MTRIIQLIDNLDFARDRTETKADHTIRFAWQADNGGVESAELDLTTPHVLEYLAALRKLGEHSNPAPASSGKALMTVRPEEQRGSKASPVRDQGLGASKKYRAAQRDYADRFAISRLDGSGMPAYLTPSGGKYWPEWLDASYQHFLATGQAIVPFAQPEYEAAGEDRSWKSYLFEWTPERKPRHILGAGDTAMITERGR